MQITSPNICCWSTTFCMYSHFEPNGNEMLHMSSPYGVFLQNQLVVSTSQQLMLVKYLDY
jgi:hypothetical protein